MTHNIIPALEHLAFDITLLDPLPGNPQKGNVGDLVAVLRDLGQHRPVVARRTEDGRAMTLVGNHMVQAAKILGWTEIAVAFVDDDEDTALVRALADNRVQERSRTDAVLLQDMLPDVIPFAPELFETLGWDVFELAVNEREAEQRSTFDGVKGYVPPPSITPPIDAYHEAADDDAPVAPLQFDQADTKATITSGATATGNAGAKAVQQFVLVFPDGRVAKRWSDFVKWLRADPGSAGGTVAERIIDFCEQHADF